MEYFITNDLKKEIFDIPKEIRQLIDFSSILVMDFPENFGKTELTFTSLIDGAGETFIFDQDDIVYWNTDDIELVK